MPKSKKKKKRSTPKKELRGLTVGDFDDFGHLLLRDDEAALMVMD